MIIQIQPWINELELEELTKVINSTYTIRSLVAREARAAEGRGFRASRSCRYERARRRKRERR